MAKTLMFCSLLMLIITAAKAADPALVLYLSLDEGKGDTVKDLSGNGNNGTLEDGPKWVDGKFGKALEFSEGNRVYMPASKSLHGDIFKGEFTLLAWVKPIPGGNQWGHIWRSVDGNDATQCTLFYNSGNFVSWRGQLDGTWAERCVSLAGTVIAEEWTYVAVVGDKNEFKIYANGEEAAAWPFVEMDGDITDYYLGYDDRRTWSEWFTGAIDEVYILTRAMTADEIKAGLEGPMMQIISVRPAGKLAVTWGRVRLAVSYAK